MFVVDICSFCNKTVSLNRQGISCAGCQHSFHVKCAALSLSECKEIISKNKSWFCVSCINNLFPFNHITNDFDFYNAIGIDFTLLDKSKHFQFHPFSPQDNKFMLNNGDIDPENNFFQ